MRSILIAQYTIRERSVQRVRTLRANVAMVMRLRTSAQCGKEQPGAQQEWLDLHRCSARQKVKPGFAE
jgi:hypothetical protein